MRWLVASDIHGSATACRRVLDAFVREKADGLLLLYSVEEQPVDMQTGQVIMDSTKGADEQSSGGKYE